MEVKANLNTKDSERLLKSLNLEENLVSKLSENLLNRNWVNYEELTSKLIPKRKNVERQPNSILCWLG